MHQPWISLKCPLSPSDLPTATSRSPKLGCSILCPSQTLLSSVLSSPLVLLGCPQVSDTSIPLSVSTLAWGRLTAPSLCGPTPPNPAFTALSSHVFSDSVWRGLARAVTCLLGSPAVSSYPGAFHSYSALQPAFSLSSGDNYQTSAL